MKKITKKLTLILGAIFMMVLPLLTVSPTYAAEKDTKAASSCDSGDVFADRGFLGIKPWYSGLADSSGNIIMPQDDADLPCFTWTIVANITSSIASIAAVFAIGFVIYGGYLYIFSGGDVGKTTKGRKTLYTAFIGLAIVILSNVIFGTIRVVMYANGSSSNDGLVNRNVGELVTDLIHWFTGIAGTISLIFLVYGAISYITSSGDSGKLTKAKSCILYALIGMAIVGCAEIIVSFYMNTITHENTSLLNDITTIAKGGL